MWSPDGAGEDVPAGRTAAVDVDLRLPDLTAIPKRQLGQTLGRSVPAPLGG